MASQVYEDTYQAPYTEEAIGEDDEKDVIEDVYDVVTRDDTQLQRAQLQRYVVRYSNGTICYPFGIKYVLKLSNRVSVPRRHNCQGCPMKQCFGFTSLESRGQAF